MRSSPADAPWAKVSSFNSVASLIGPSDTGGGLQAAAGDAGGAALLLWAFLLNKFHTLSISASDTSYPIGYRYLDLWTTHKMCII